MSKRMRHFSRFGTVGMLIALLAPVAMAQTTYPFDLPAQSLAESLRAIGHQTSTNVMFEPRLVKNLKAAALRVETTTVEEAIRILLSGTQLNAVRTAPDSILIQQATRDTGNTTSTPGSVNKKNESARVSGGELLLNISATDSVWLAQAGDTSSKAKKKEDDKNGSAVEEMIVEKDRIRAFSDANLDLPRTTNDPQPYYIFDSKEIERSGALNVQDFLRQRLTMDTTYETNAELATTSGHLGGSFGNAVDGEGIPGSTISSFNLRGLGAGKTLILINGRRVAGVNYSRSNSMDERQPDLNGIALTAVDRIEVLPSSASAIYGAGAIGGVINVVLKRSFHGGDLRVSYDTPSNSSASTTMVAANYGFSLEGGKTQVMTSASFSTSDPMILNDRAEFAESGFRYLLNSWSRSLEPGTDGPYATVETAIAANLRGTLGPTGAYVAWRGNPNLVLKDGTVLLTPGPYGVRLGYIAPGVTSSTPMTQRWVPYGPELFGLTPGYGQFGRKQPLGSVSDVKSLNVSLARQMGSRWEAFADLQFQENQGGSLYVPSMYFFFQSTNANTPFQNSRVDFGTTLSTPVHLQSTSETRSMTLGLKGRFSNDWAGELSFSRSENTFDHGYNLPNTSRFSQDIAAGLVDVFVDPFTVNFDLSPYDLSQPFTSRARSDVMSARLAGPAFHLPWGDPVISIGLERYKPSRPSGSGTVGYTFDGSPLLGFTPRVSSFTTHLGRSTANYAAYIEGRIPVITEKNAIPLVRALDVQIAQRISRSVAETGTTSVTVFYNAAGAVTSTSYAPTAVGGIPISREVTYNSSNETFALRYEPLDGVALRASVGTAFIPPTYTQLIPDQQLVPALPNGQMITNDPVTGLSYRVDSISGGNPSLKPQRSRSIDLGLIYEPRGELLKGLRANLQYYQIGQFDFISSPNLTEVLTLPDFAGRVIRDPVSRQVTQVDLSLTNIAERSSAGVDLAFDYDLPSSFGNWHFSLGGTKVLYERRQVSVTAPMIDYAGFPGSGGPVKYKANSNLIWGLRQLTLGWTTNWYGHYGISGSPGSPGGFQANGTWVLQGSYSVPAQTYHHVFASYNFGRDVRYKMLSGFTLQLNVQNVFNTVPPFDVTRPPFYMSPLGSYRLRSYTLAVKKEF